MAETRFLVVTQYFWPESFRINGVVHCLNDPIHELAVYTANPPIPVSAALPGSRAFRAEGTRDGALTNCACIRLEVT
jgi:hypothetical protein